MKRLIFFLLLFAATKVAGQTTGYLRFDTVRIMKQNGTCELYIINKTKDSLGLLTNVGGGLTRFIKSRANGDTLFIGLDTLVVEASAGNANVGIGYRVLKEVDQTIKTFFSDVTGAWDTTSNTNGLTYKVDTFTLETRDRGIKTIDSVHSIIQADLDGKQPTGNYITATTGDVVSTGPGSVPATIQANAVTTTKIADNNVTTAKIADNNVTNGKFRQSVATAVVGRATNSTGNVADIAASVASTVLKMNTAGTAILFDSLSYGELKDVPPTVPGIYISPAQSLNQGFLVEATGILYPTNAYSNGATIAWGILNQASGHNSSFVDSVYGDPSTNQLQVRFPTVKNVIIFSIASDETFVDNGVQAGASTGFSLSTANVKRVKAIGIKLRGDGSTTWVKQSDGSQYNSSFTLSTYSTANGSTSFNMAVAINNYSFDYSSMQLQYIGQNGYKLIRKYSGLGADNIGFILTDGFNNPVTIAPTSTDEVVMSNTGMATETVNMRTYGASNTFMGTFTNFNFRALFEAWMVAAPLSSTTVQVRYQTVYPSATSYKIYRGTHLYHINTLVHTGTTGLFVDAGLTANTIYYYKMVAVVGGVDTDVTTFRTNTNF